MDFYIAREYISNRMYALSFSVYAYQLCRCPSFFAAHEESACSNSYLESFKELFALYLFNRYILTKKLNIGLFKLQ